jgi:hypothetical protein
MEALVPDPTAREGGTREGPFVPVGTTNRGRLQPGLIARDTVNPGSSLQPGLKTTL